MFLKKLITKIKCRISHINYQKGMFIHPLCSIQKSNGGVINCSEEIKLQSNTFVRASKKGKLQLGKSSFFNAGTRIDCRNEIIIEDAVIVGPYVYIADFNHEYKNVDKKIKDQLLAIGRIKIGKGSWIGAHCTIVGMVNIGKHCVIGANSVVTSDIPDYCVAVGAPARVIKKYCFINKEWIRI